MKKLLKKFLSRTIIDRLKVILSNIDLKVVRLARRSPLLSGLYYSLLSGEFRREMHAVLNGRYHFLTAGAASRPNVYMLRRNIHRIEKGLCMIPRKPVFASKYILSTVKNFELCLSREVLAESELNWVQDVLEQYFSEVEVTPSINQAREEFLKLKNNGLAGTIDKRVPFQHEELDTSSIDFSAFKTLCEKRHSVRWFKPQPVPRHIIDQAIAVAVTAPSACNRQPFQFFVFDDPEQASEIGSIPMGTAGFSDNFQCILVVVADLSAYPLERDRHIIYIDSALASMQLLLALETQGLSSCVINWPDVERLEQKMSDRLSLEVHQRPVMLIAVGYADEKGLIPFSEKQSAKDSVRRS